MSVDRFTCRDQIIAVSLEGKGYPYVESFTPPRTVVFVLLEPDDTLVTKNHELLVLTLPCICVTLAWLYCRYYE